MLRVCCVVCAQMCVFSHSCEIRSRLSGGGCHLLLCGGSAAVFHSPHELTSRRLDSARRHLPSPHRRDKDVCYHSSPSTRAPRIKHRSPGLCGWSLYPLSHLVPPKQIFFLLPSYLTLLLGNYCLKWYRCVPQAGQ